MENKKNYTISEVRNMFKAYTELARQQDFAFSLLIRGKNEQYKIEMKKAVRETFETYNEVVPSNVKEIIPIDVSALEKILK